VDVKDRRSKKERDEQDETSKSEHKRTTSEVGLRNEIQGQNQAGDFSQCHHRDPKPGVRAEGCVADHRNG
jgi:hypothetical protein